MNRILFILSVVVLGIMVLLTCVGIDKLISIVVKLIENVAFETKFFKKLNNKLNAVLE